MGAWSNLTAHWLLYWTLWLQVPQADRWDPRRSLHLLHHLDSLLNIWLLLVNLGDYLDVRYCFRAWSHRRSLHPVRCLAGNRRLWRHWRLLPRILHLRANADAV